MSIERDGKYIILTYNDFDFVSSFIEMIVGNFKVSDFSDEEKYELIDDLVDYSSLNGFDSPTDTVEEWIKERESK